MEHSLLYRVGPHEKEDFLTGEIRTLLAEFGAEVYSVPPEFTERVGHYIEQYQGPDRPLVAKALNGAAPQLRAMRQILEGNSYRRTWPTSRWSRARWCPANPAPRARSAPGS